MPSCTYIKMKNKYNKKCTVYIFKCVLFMSINETSALYYFVICFCFFKIQRNMAQLQSFVCRTEDTLGLRPEIPADPDEVSLCLHNHKVLTNTLSCPLVNC